MKHKGSNEDDGKTPVSPFKRMSERGRPSGRQFPVLLLLAPLLCGLALTLMLQNPRFLIFVALIPIIMVGNWIEDRRTAAAAPKTPALHRLSGIVSELDSTLRDLDHEARERATVLAQLKQRAEHYESLAGLTEEQAQAVAAQIQLGVVATQRRGYVVNGLINLGVAALAFAVGQAT